MATISTEKLLKIYKTVRVKTKIKPKYPPARKHYNAHLFG